MELKKGNLATITIGPILDSTGATVSTLGTATSIAFYVKTDPTDSNAAALITKLSTGTSPGITVNSPSSGYVAIAISATDTASLSAGKKYMGLQITWNTTNIQEIDITESGSTIDSFNLTQDVAR